ncbi:hypothetical protein NSQ24_01250 [Brevibacillus sp. FSL L8-0520]|uniref:hypothetical protein n=1 Tax=Brevibacillus TaxID=55080 RepID=UPI00204113E4|nr:hypothetical protein [Brevibacillus borstelensis]MCM3560633.1 hypothetical protein [Brevibacillus borstelensis]
MMSISRHPDYVQAADELKQALVNYCHEVTKIAPELKGQTDQLMRSVLMQDNAIFNQLRVHVKENSPS